MTLPADQATSQIFQAGRKRFNIALRKPWQLPDDKIQLPSPERLPNMPSQPSVLQVALPPAIMVVGTLLTSIFMGRFSLALVIPALMMAMGYPLANQINYRYQKKKYDEFLQVRAANYVTTLKQFKAMIQRLAEQQKQALENEYPACSTVVEIGCAAGENPRLWWRRRHDGDFLSVRIGSHDGEPSFQILPPRTAEQDDPLGGMPFDLIEQFEVVPGLPFKIDLKQAGSLMIAGDTAKARYGLLYRIIADLLVHHSPEDINLALFSNDVDAAAHWNWLKWAPHTHSLEPNRPHRSLLFSETDIHNFLGNLTAEVNARLDRQKRYESGTVVEGQALVIVLDDSGPIRQLPDVAHLAAIGYTVGVYLLFLGEHGTPNSCRGRLDVKSDGRFRYLETWVADGRGETLRGTAEFLPLEECERMARSLAGLRVAGGKSVATLPSMVRMADILGDDPYSTDTVVRNWSRVLPPSEQVLFPLGLYVDRSGLRTMEIDFRPEGSRFNGEGEYHAMLVGTTGSGKSIQLQSTVLATAHRYSPRYVNFLFMDFKAGATELKKVSNLPHVVGMISDLDDSLLAERALQALENELDRRKKIFDAAGSITDIWDFNDRFKDQALPHLLTVIDEFTEGIRFLPDLIERLRELGRQGRAFGMYFFLANQEVNSQVESLKSNVGWYVVLKVKRVDEMSLVDKSLPIARGRGHGYVRVKSDFRAFQGAYAGDKMVDQSVRTQADFSVFEIGPDGRYEVEHANAVHFGQSEGARSIPVELDILLERMEEASQILGFEKARQIYMEPVATDLPLSAMLTSQPVFRRFEDASWSEAADPERKLKIPVGMLDLPKECMQQPMVLDFTGSGSNLWIVGSPGSGKADTVESILLGLAATHRPDEAQFYILEFGTGSLRALDELPHTGAVIRLNEKARIERLFAFLTDQLDQRADMDWQAAGLPHIFLVINNYLDFKNSFYDQSQDVLRLVRQGGGVGIHFIVTTSMAANDLGRNISEIISQRIALQMPTEAFIDVAGRRVPPLSTSAPGRGYFIDKEGFLAECQVARPQFLSAAGSNGQGDDALNLRPQLIAAMDAWKGARPTPIRELGQRILYPEFQELLESSGKAGNRIKVPVGIAYSDLSLFEVDLLAADPFWAILGPSRSGKSNLLLSIGQSLETAYPGMYHQTAYALRRGPVSALKGKIPHLEVFNQIDACTEHCNALLEMLVSDSTGRHLLLLDDLGTLAEPGNEELRAALDELAGRAANLDNLFVVGTGSREDFQALGQNTPIMRLLKRPQTGMCFSNDPTDIGWFGIPVSLAERKRELPVGRGFFMKEKAAHLVHIPLLLED